MSIFACAPTPITANFRIGRWTKWKRARGSRWTSAKKTRWTLRWKASKPGEPAWDSPWGPGRPGWHIECSAMNLKEHGPQIDIHGGGFHVLFPHHENEVAQSESFTGCVPFSRFWVHNALLHVPGQEKMTRHLGGLVYIPAALERHSSDAIRA